MATKKTKSLDELIDECTEMLSNPATAEKGFKRLQIIEEKGSSKAACMMAVALSRGDGVKKDPNLAFATVSRYRNGAYPDAHYILGSFYEHGIGTERDIERAIFFYKMSSGWNFPLAYTALARCYREGIGVEQDLEHAFAMTMMSANLGDADSMYEVAVCYLNGLGVEEDTEETQKWIIKASDAGSVKASVLWGDVCIDQKDYEGAVKFFTRAADKEEPHAMFVLHQCYRDGLGVKIDKKKAFELCSKAAELGDIDALNDMGIWYENGYDTIKKNYAEALKWYLKAAEAGNSLGWLNAGYAYTNGRGTKPDQDKAYECYKKSADMGNEGGICSVGWCYREGTGVKKDLSKAFKYLCTAALLGDAEAMDSVGYAYEYGKGVDKDKNLAFRFYMEAAQKDVPNAMRNVAECYLMGTGVEKDIDEAKKWYKKAEETNYSGMDELKKIFDKELKGQ